MYNCYVTMCFLTCLNAELLKQTHCCCDHEQYAHLYMSPAERFAVFDLWGFGSPARLMSEGGKTELGSESLEMSGVQRTDRMCEISINTFQHSFPFTWLYAIVVLPWLWWNFPVITHICCLQHNTDQNMFYFKVRCGCNSLKTLLSPKGMI